MQPFVAQPDQASPRVKIVPSILASDYTRLGDELARMEQSGADMAHIDVMDGLFVPNITIGPCIVKALRACSALPFDVHLMVEKPERFLKAFAEAGANRLTVHAEACPHLDRTLLEIRELGLPAAVALNPHTPLCYLDWVIGGIDMVLLMTVNPGYGGQRLIEGALAKIHALRGALAREGRQLDIEVDGGVTLDNVGSVAAAGANVIVAGSALFGAKDMREAVARMRRVAQQALDAAHAAQLELDAASAARSALDVASAAQSEFNASAAAQKAPSAALAAQSARGAVFAEEPALDEATVAQKAPSAALAAQSALGVACAEEQSRCAACAIEPPRGSACAARPIRDTAYAARSMLGASYVARQSFAVNMGRGWRRDGEAE